MAYPRIASLKSYESFVERLSELDLVLPCDAEVYSGLARSGGALDCSR